MSKTTRKTTTPPVEHWLLDEVEARFGLQARRGFTPLRADRDRTEVYASWIREGFVLTVSFDDGGGAIQHLGIGIVPSQGIGSFGLRHAVAALDPELHARHPEPGPSMDRAATLAWLDAHARFFDAHAEALLERPHEVLARVKEVEPLGEQCVELVAMCREILRLEADFGFEPPRAIHWAHDCEIEFRRGSRRVLVRLEDHEKAGVTQEPFTVPELYLCAADDTPEQSLTERAAALDPAHAARRPVAPRYAMALPALRPWLEHDAAFLRAHPELLDPPTVHDEGATTA